MPDMSKGGLLDGHPEQVLTQLIGIGAVIALDAIMSFIILKVIDLVIGLRVDEETEIEGLDLALHGEVVP
jgi:Amt family ammonium transporter